MKELRLFSQLMICLLVACLSLTSSCSLEQVVPTSQSQEEISSLQSRTDYSGLEECVKDKIALRENIARETISHCAYICSTAQGYGRYDFIAGAKSGSFFVTGIIGDECEGF